MKLSMNARICASFTAAAISLLLVSCGGRAVTPAASTGNALVPNVRVDASTGLVELSVLQPSVGPTIAGSRPAYVSAGTERAKIMVNGQSVPQSGISVRCDGAPGGVQCVYKFNAPAGNDSFLVALLNSSGAALSQGKTLQNIPAGNAPTLLHILLHGIVKTVSLALDVPNPPVGKAATVHLTAKAYDASGYEILGDDYANPIKISTSLQSPHLRLSSHVLQRPGQAIVMHYSGQSTPGIFFGATPQLNGPALFSPESVTRFGPTSYAIHSLARGPDGNVWFAESYNGHMQARIGRVTADGKIKEFPRIGSAGRIISGPDDAMWFTRGESALVGRIDMAGHMSAIRVRPAGQYFRSGGIAVGADRNIWITEWGWIDKITPSGKVTYYSLGKVNVPDDLVLADNRLWFEYGSNVGAITPRGVITSYKAPSQGYSGNFQSFVVGPDKRIYFFLVRKLASMTTSGVFSWVPLANRRSIEIAPVLSVGPDHKLWVSASREISYATRVGGPASIETSGQAAFFPELSFNGFSGEYEAWDASNHLWAADGNYLYRFTYVP